MWSRVSVGLSKAPIATAIRSLATGSQKRKDPQTAQNPRRTFSDERNQVSCSAPWTVSAVRGMSVEAQKWPDCLRHCEQWQASGGVRLSATSKRTAPHKQDPV